MGSSQLRGMISAEQSGDYSTGLTARVDETVAPDPRVPPLSSLSHRSRQSILIEIADFEVDVASSSLESQIVT